MGSAAPCKPRMCQSRAENAGCRRLGSATLRKQGKRGSIGTPSPHFSSQETDARSQRFATDSIDSLSATREATPEWIRTTDLRIVRPSGVFRRTTLRYALACGARADGERPRLTLRATFLYPYVVDFIGSGKWIRTTDLRIVRPSGVFRRTTLRYALACGARANGERPRLTLERLSCVPMLLILLVAGSGFEPLTYGL